MNESEVRIYFISSALEFKAYLYYNLRETDGFELGELVGLFDGLIVGALDGVEVAVVIGKGG
jgi:hypothetical protein